MDQPSSGPLVRAVELEKVYAQEGHMPIRALDRVTLEVEPGEFTAVAGPSGSGKTTLLNIIGGLDQPTAGHVKVAGQTLGDLSRTALAAFRLNYLGFIFQAFNLIPVLTAEENAEFILLLQGVDKDERRRRVALELEGLGITPDMRRRRPAKLSGGQQQRVAIARALVARPKLILADEPTGSLDSTSGARLLDKMRDLNERTGITFLFSTHDPMIIERAKRLITLRDGRIISDEYCD